jgi:hypothetical protein
MKVSVAENDILKNKKKQHPEKTVVCIDLFIFIQGCDYVSVLLKWFKLEP